MITVDIRWKLNLNNHRRKVCLFYKKLQYTVSYIMADSWKLQISHTKRWIILVLSGSPNTGLLSLYQTLTRRTLSPPYIPSTKLATAAVHILLAHSNNACCTLNSPSGIQPITMATRDARKPTTIAWACNHYIIYIEA